MPILATTALQL